MPPARPPRPVRAGQAAARREAAPRPRPLGTLGEELAARHLRRRGFAIVARNARTRHGEIDLIAFDGSTLAFVEVKTRRLGREGRAASGHAEPAKRQEPDKQHREPDKQHREPGRQPEFPLEGLRARQRARLRRLAVAWLYGAGRPRLRAATIRFDAVGVLVDAGGELVRLDHVEAAW